MSERVSLQDKTADSNGLNWGELVARSTGGVTYIGDKYDNRGLEPMRPGMYDRGVEEYSLRINGPLGADGPGFDIENFRGKRLLDLGSGAYESFGLDARKDGVDVVSVNPALVFKNHRTLLFEDNKHHERRQTPGKKFFRGVRSVIENIRPGDLTVAALGQKLPFKSEAFDGVVSVYGVPHYLYVNAEYSKDPEQQDALAFQEILQALTEVCRVLKPGGVAFLVDGHSAEPVDGNQRVSPSLVNDALEELTGAKADIFEHIENTESSAIGVPPMPMVVRTIRITKSI